MNEIKHLHATSPRYSYAEESTASLLQRCNVIIRDQKVIYAPSAGKKVLIQSEANSLYAETFAQSFYEDLGFRIFQTESVPFHVIFGVFNWILIQDPTDPECQLVHFDERDAYERDRSKQPISIVLPSDFGNSGYVSRRSDEIAEHLALLKRGDGEGGLVDLFDYWVDHSWGLRQYLWAHRSEDVETARKLVVALPQGEILKILEYLLGAYWNRYLGWPDMLGIRNGELLFVEVKSSNDKLTDDQKRWIKDNHTILGFPFELFKLHRVAAQQNVAGDI